MFFFLFFFFHRLTLILLYSHQFRQHQDLLAFIIYSSDLLEQRYTQVFKKNQQKKPTAYKYISLDHNRKLRYCIRHNLLYQLILYRTTQRIKKNQRNCWLKKLSYQIRCIIFVIILPIFHLGVRPPVPAKNILFLCQSQERPSAQAILKFLLGFGY